MAEFCKQCSKDGGSDFKLSPAQIAIHAFSPRRKNVGLCEGCGGTEFDFYGRCIDIECKVHGKENRERRGL